MTDQSVIKGDAMRKSDEEKRERILKAAIALFAARGFENASVADIATEADVAKGTVYLYFPSKDALIDQVYDYCHEQDAAACAKGLDGIDKAAEKLCLRMENAIRYALAHPQEAAVERMYLSLPSRSGTGTSYVRQPLHFKAVDAIMRRGVAKGELKDLPTTLLGEIFFSIGGAFYFYLIANPGLAEDAGLWEKAYQTVHDCLAR